MSARPQCRASIRCAPILPNDGIVDGTTRSALPNNRGLALVGDADGGDLSRLDASAGDRRLRGRNDARPDFFRIVLDETRRRIDLPEFLLRRRDRTERRIEDDRARRGRALIDRKKVIGQIRSPAAPVTIASGRQRSRITSPAYRSTVHAASVRLRSHKHKDVSCATGHSRHDICQARAFFRRKTQAQLCAPPEHIVRGLRPFLLDEVSHL